MPQGPIERAASQGCWFRKSPSSSDHFQTIVSPAGYRRCRQFLSHSSVSYLASLSFSEPYFLVVLRRSFHQYLSLPSHNDPYSFLDILWPSIFAAKRYLRQRLSYRLISNNHPLPSPVTNTITRSPPVPSHSKERKRSVRCYSTFGTPTNTSASFHVSRRPLLEPPDHLHCLGHSTAFALLPNASELLHTFTCGQREY